MKKYLWMSLAALGFVACEKGIDDGNQQTGEMEQSYVAITLAATDVTTRATNGNPYEEGRDEERKVESAYVFFFKDKAAFPVTFNETTSTSSNAGTSNYLEVNLTGNNKDMDNVSDVKDAVLVLQNYQGEYPNQIVAVLNWDPTQKASYTLDELKTKISDLGNDTDGYVMSNSVYLDHAGQTIDAVNLTIDNIGKTAEEALANPVTIHVERVAAKVVFTAPNNGKFNIAENVNGQPVYAQIEGFELFNDIEKSWLIKRIKDTWTDTELGFVNWNDPTWFRSYWAQSLGTTYFGAANNFDWEENDAALSGNSQGLNEYVYCGENTLEWTEANDVRTKVIVKAKLVDASGNPLEVVNWYGKNYIGEEKLKTVVANTLANTYFYSADGQTFTSISYADIVCVERGPGSKKAYEVYFKLSEETGLGIHKTWYKYEGGNYIAINDNADLNAALAAVQPALVYNDGMTYYYTNIKHLGAEGKTAQYGVVRNHVYKVNISDIKGFGTPVYNGTTDFITPEKPEDIVTYVSAQINILSWRIVANNYPLN